MNELEIQIRTLEKRNHRLQERLNRIANVMIGNRRIWELDRLAMECEVMADGIEKDITAGKLAQSCTESVALFRTDALYLKRLEHDLGTLHVAVRGDTNRRGGRYDQADWRGPRP